MKNTTLVGAGPGRVLRALEQVGTALTITDLAGATGLHQNTLRAHVGTLLDAGRISRRPMRSGGRGRPRWGYVVRPEEHAALARALADGLAGLDDAETERAALRCGRAWGRRVVTEVGHPSDSARERVVGVLQHTGFAPEGGAQDPIRLTRCPIIETARDHPEVVCRVHQGMLEGALGAAGPPAGSGTDRDTDHDTGGSTAAGPRVRPRLWPFAEPGACWVLLIEEREATSG